MLLTKLPLISYTHNGDDTSSRNYGHFGMDFNFYTFFNRTAVFQSDMRWRDMREHVYSYKYEYSNLCMQVLPKGGRYDNIKAMSYPHHAAIRIQTKPLKG